MISAQDAISVVLDHVFTLGTEEIPLSCSLHRCLARPVVAPISLPPFDNSAMDGFVIGSPNGPFETKGTIAAGDEGPSQILPGEAFRIMTGAPVPRGAFAVVPFEEWPISEEVTPGDNVRRAGEDVRVGQSLLETGEKIGPRTIALLAALGLTNVAVFKKPRIRLLSTGSELRQQGEALRPGQIYNSNGPALLAVLKELGIEVSGVNFATDSEEELERALGSSTEFDALITIGAVSAGDFDLVPQVLKKLGAKILFHKVSIKPGKPLLFATLSEKPIFSLPGNPVSAIMVFDRFVRPALLKMMGAQHFFRTRLTANAGHDLKGSAGKEDYLRGIVDYQDGRYLARSAGPQGSAHLLPLARANAVLIIPPDKKMIAKGETVTFEFL